MPIRDPGLFLYPSVCRIYTFVKGGEKVKAATTKEAVSRLREFGPTCSPKQLASVLGGQPYRFTVLARNGKLPYDHEWHGEWLRIFTESVIKRITAV